MGVNPELPRECRDVRAWLALLPSGDLSPQEDAWVRGHLRACFACARELGGHLRAAAALRQAASPPADAPHFFASLEAGILDRVRREPMPCAQATQRRVRQRRWASVAAGLLLFVGGAVLVRFASPGAPWLAQGEARQATPRRAQEESPFRELGKLENRQATPAVPKAYGLQARSASSRWVALGEWLLGVDPADAADTQARGSGSGR